jgi:Response regulator containing CheY-like receiver, AAA-type ATPase, and DNA-binding domains
VVAATNRPPEESVKKGALREDLYYRLNVFHIHLPPLRERKEDIQPIADSLITILNSKHECRVTGISPEVQEIFQTYNWPGNVRELRNALERAVILAGQGSIERTHLSSTFTSPSTESSAVEADCVQFRVGTTVEEAERGLIMRTLEHTRNNKTKAAEILGISLKTLHNKLKEYGAATVGAE